jgi:hypothetical protein
VFIARYGMGIYTIQGPVHVRSALGKVAQGQVFLRAVLFVAVSIPIHHCCSRSDW